MTDSPDNPQALRTKAESLREKGNAPSSRGHTLSADALAVLYKLSRAPDNSSDSLKILHELQTHQIELDLMQEQSEANEREILAQLDHYKVLYEYAPVGYLVVSQNGRVIESNPAGAALLGTTCSEIDGCPLEGFLSPASRPLVGWQLKKLFSGSPKETCTVQTNASQTSTLRILANRAPNEALILMILTALEPRPA